MMFQSMFHSKSKIMFCYKFCFMFCYKFHFKQNVLLHLKWTWRVTWWWQSWRRGTFCWNSVHTCLRPCTPSSCFGYDWLNVMDDVFCCMCQWGCPGWHVKLKQNQKCVTLILIIVYFHLHVDHDTQERNLVRSMYTPKCLLHLRSSPHLHIHQVCLWQGGFGSTSCGTSETQFVS